MKADRQKEILRIISEYEVETQDDLIKYLKQRGYDTTQATISRDIRNLGLHKVPGDTGHQKYVASSVTGRRIGNDELGGNESYKNVLSGGIVDYEIAGNIVVVKTISGMAMAVGAAIDSMSIDGVVGCIACDDTIFIAVKSVSLTEKVVTTLKGIS
jgi:transcriptional regulator of arginine metabolism